MRKTYLFAFQHMPITLPAAGQVNLVAANVSAAVIPATGGQLQTVAVANDFQQSSEVEFRFTRSSGGTLGAVVILPGAGLNGTFADLNTAGTTFSSRDWKNIGSTLAANNYQNYFKHVGCYVDAIRFDTDNVANYNESILLGTRLPNGTVRGRNVNLSQFRQSTGNSYANTAAFTDNSKYLVVSKDLYMEMSNLALNSSFSIFMNIVAKETIVQVSEIKY